MKVTVVSVEAKTSNFSNLLAGTKIMILGDMFELGEASEEEHLEIVKIIREKKINKVYTAGPYFFKAAMGSTEFECYNTTDELLKALAINAPTNATILIKGSRGMKLETIISVL